MHVLDNEAPDLCRDAIEETNSKCQLVPRHFHGRSTADRSARTFNQHFLRVITSVCQSFPMSMRDKLIEQFVITLNFLCVFCDEN